MPGGRRRPRVWAAPLWVLMAGLSVGSAQASEVAAREPRIGIHVEIETPPQTIHERSDPLLPRGGSGDRRLAGLALLDLSLQTEYDMTLVSYSSGENFFWVSGIHLTLAYRNPEVYIAGRYRKGSCEYRAVLDHEDEHVLADRAVVKSFAEKMGLALRAGDWPTYAHPRQVSSMEEGKAETAARLEAIIQPLFEELKERRREARLALDSPENARRAQQQCASR